MPPIDPDKDLIRGSKVKIRKAIKSSKKPKISKNVIAEIFARFEKNNPDPKCELEYSNAYTLLVAVVLSAQASDKSVNKATRILFREAQTPQEMVTLGEEVIRNHIKSIGLFRNKAKNVLKLSQCLISTHNGNVPCDRDILETLPGVGRKTANVVMNVWFKKPTIAVDTHVFRVSNRLGLAPGESPLEVENILQRVLPSRYSLLAHQWLILHGRYICLSRKPACHECYIRDLCVFKNKTL